MRPVNVLPLLIPAPGRWTLDRARGVVEAELTVPTSDGLDEALLDTLDVWRRQLRRAAAPVLQHAELVEGDGTITLRWPAPERVGSQLLDADVPIEQRLRWLDITGRALDSLHAHGLVHGGLGLDSVWMTGDVVTFPDVALTDALFPLMPPPPLAGVYAAPEVRQQRLPEPATDVFALAVVAHEILSGAPRSQIATTDGVTSVDAVMVEPNRAIFPGAPSAMTDVIARGLAAAPAARYPSCALLTTTLQRTWRATPSTAARVSEIVVQQAEQLSQRHANTRRLVLVILAGLAGGALYGYSVSRPAETSPSVASTSRPVTALLISRQANDRIFIDGVMVTTTDSMIAVPAGLHEVEVFAADGKRVVRRLELAAGQTTRLTLE